MVKEIVVGITSMMIFCGCCPLEKQPLQKMDQTETKGQVNRMGRIQPTDAFNKVSHWEKAAQREGNRVEKIQSNVEPSIVSDRDNRIETATNDSLKPKKNNKKKIGRKYFESLGVVWDVPIHQKVMALTFDDGPNSKYTPEILKSLEQYHAKATFFVSGKFAEYYPGLVRREVSEGHEVANHTYSHPRIWKLSNEQIRKEIDQTQRAIISATGKKPTLFRPIGGYLSERIVKIAKDQGYTVILWSWHQDTQDWRKPGVSKIVNKVVMNARGGDIVLFHDHGGDRSQTVQALKQILPKLQKKGYKFVTVSELLQIKTK